MSEQPDSNSEDKDLRIYTYGAFTDDYKRECFYIWYNNGKPSIAMLKELIPFPETNYGRKPSNTTLQNWLVDFKDQSEALDVGLEKTMNEAMLTSKIEMMLRHIKLGKEMQDIALNWLREHTEDLTAASVVRLLVAGRDIERESQGIPSALTKMSQLTEEQLYEEVKKALEDGQISDFEDVE